LSPRDVSLVPFDWLFSRICSQMRCHFREQRNWAITRIMSFPQFDLIDDAIKDVGY
jgi:hypothetical protein